MNQREKEQYLREYATLKAQGKPFFPYAVAKDSAMAAIVLLVIVVMAIVLGAEMGPKADPTTTTYVPRPEWYFFFLFELLRVIKPPEYVPLATIGVPTICMILLFLLPFYDRSPERRPERRPIATAAGVFTIAAMAYLTYIGDRVGRDAIARTLVNPTSPMPSYESLRQNEPEQFEELVTFIASLKESNEHDAAPEGGGESESSKH